MLLTDGQTENENECLMRADDAGRMGVPITALGVGKDWNEDLLIDMANRSGGTADYIDQPDKIIEYFQNTVQRAQATVAGRYTGSQSRVQNALDSLERIKQKQAERGARLQSAAELSRENNEDVLDAKLRAAGITPQAGSAQTVLERLKAQQQASKSA